MKFEILLSTQNQTDLNFLDKMFTNSSFEGVNVLIINQILEGEGISQKRDNVRVINSFEKGSPNSRNLAIQNAEGEICLFADDDIIYLKDFREKIVQKHEEFPDTDVITFEAIDKEGKQYLKYEAPGWYKKNKFKVNTYVISFKRKAIQQNEIRFNKHFGVGSTFPGSTEFFFMESCWKAGLKMRHESIFIAQHPNISSGKKQGSDNAIASRTALRYRKYGWLSYPWVIKYVLDMIRFNYISWNEFFPKITVGLNAIKTYKKLKKQGDMP